MLNKIINRFHNRNVIFFKHFDIHIMAVFFVLNCINADLLHLHYINESNGKCA